MSLATREQKAVVTDFCVCRALWFFHAMKERIRFKIYTKNTRQLTPKTLYPTIGKHCNKLKTHFPLFKKENHLLCQRELHTETKVRGGSGV